MQRGPVVYVARIEELDSLGAHIQTLAPDLSTVL